MQVMISVWLMNGADLVAGVELNPKQVPDTSWKPVGTGDFDRDSKTDILWQRADGSLLVWFMDGVNLTSNSYLNPSQVAANTGWKPISTGDFNRDGKTDILWSNNAGYLSVWFMDGINLVSSSYLNPNQIAADTGWKPVGAP
jgi:FG-GAP-like repeat